MQVSDIALNQGGQISYRKWTITYADLQSFATGASPQQFPLWEVSSPGPNGSPPTFSFPQGSKVLGVCIHHTTPFSGGTLLSMTVSLGTNGSTVDSFASAFNIFQAAADSTLSETALFKLGQITALKPAVNFICTVSGGTNTPSLATAGSVDIYVCWLNVSSDSE